MAKSNTFRSTGPRPTSTPEAYSSVYKRSRPKMPLTGPAGQPPQIYEEGLGYAASGKMILEAARAKQARQQRNRLTAMARRRKENEKAIGHREGLLGEAVTSANGDYDSWLAASKSAPTLPAGPTTAAPSPAVPAKRGRGKNGKAKRRARSSPGRRRGTAKAETNSKGRGENADAKADANVGVGAADQSELGLDEGALEREIEAAIAREIQREKGITEDQVAEFVATVIANERMQGGGEAAQAGEAGASASANATGAVTYLYGMPVPDRRAAPGMKYESDAAPSLTIEHRLPTDYPTATAPTPTAVPLTLEIEDHKESLDDDWVMVERAGPETEASTSGVLKLVGQVPIIATSKTLLYGPAFEEHEELRSPKLVRMRQPPPKDHALLVRVAANVLHELWRNQICDDHGTDEEPEPAQWKKAMMSETEFNEWFEPALHDELVRDLSGKTDTYDQIEININCDFDLLPPSWQRDKLETTGACFEEMYRTGLYRESSVNEMVQAKAVHDQWMRRNQNAVAWVPELFVPFEELEAINPAEQFKKVRVVRACRLVRSMYEDIIEEELDNEFFAEEAAKASDQKAEVEVEVEGELFEGGFEGEFGDEVEAVGVRGDGGRRAEGWGEPVVDATPVKEYMDSFIRYEGLVGSAVKRRAAALQAETSHAQDAAAPAPSGYEDADDEVDEDDDLPPPPPAMPSLMKETSWTGGQAIKLNAPPKSPNAGTLSAGANGVQIKSVPPKVESVANASTEGIATLKWVGSPMPKVKEEKPDATATATATATTNDSAESLGLGKLGGKFTATYDARDDLKLSNEEFIKQAIKAKFGMDVEGMSTSQIQKTFGQRLGADMHGVGEGGSGDGSPNPQV